MGQNGPQNANYPITWHTINIFQNFLVVTERNFVDTNRPGFLVRSPKIVGGIFITRTFFGQSG